MASDRIRQAILRRNGLLDEGITPTMGVNDPLAGIDPEQARLLRETLGTGPFETPEDRAAQIAEAAAAEKEALTKIRGVPREAGPGGDVFVSRVPEDEPVGLSQRERRSLDIDRAVERMRGPLQKGLHRIREVLVGRPATGPAAPAPEGEFAPEPFQEEKTGLLELPFKGLAAAGKGIARGLDVDTPDKFREALGVGLRRGAAAVEASLKTPTGSPLLSGAVGAIRGLRADAEEQRAVQKAAVEAERKDKELQIDENKIYKYFRPVPDGTPGSVKIKLPVSGVSFSALPRASELEKIQAMTRGQDMAAAKQRADILIGQLDKARKEVSDLQKLGYGRAVKGPKLKIYRDALSRVISLEHTIAAESDLNTSLPQIPTSIVFQDEATGLFSNLIKSKGVVRIVQPGDPLDSEFSESDRDFMIGMALGKIKETEKSQAKYRSIQQDARSRNMFFDRRRVINGSLSPGFRKLEKSDLQR